MDYFSPEYHDPKTNIAKTPHLLGQQLPFWRFLTSFWTTKASIAIFSQHLLTKILENVFHALKLPQSKYHLIWTPRSKENQFQRSLFRGRPFEISTFKWRWLFHQLTVDTKKWFFRPPVMSFGFLDVIFGGKGLEIDTYKPPNFFW